MILVDPRAGSSDLLAPLAAAGLPVEEATLEFGDLAWMGRGEGGADIWCGLEHKKLPDLVQSLMTERLAGHQLPGLVTTYDRAYLVIEGEWDVDPAGKVIVPRAGFANRWAPLKGCPPASVLEMRIFTLETRGGLRVRWTRNQKETIRHVSNLYRGWTDRDLDQHRSHLAVHAPDMDPVLKAPVSNFRMGLMGFVDGLGMSLSRDIEVALAGRAEPLGTLRSMTQDAIAAIPTMTAKGKTKKLGMARAKNIKDALR